MSNHSNADETAPHEGMDILTGRVVMLSPLNLPRWVNDAPPFRPEQSELAHAVFVHDEPQNHDDQAACALYPPSNPRSNPRRHRRPSSSQSASTTSLQSASESTTSDDFDQETSSSTSSPPTVLTTTTTTSAASTSTMTPSMFGHSKPAKKSISRVCANCGTTASTCWRRGGSKGNHTLCNRCGLYERDHLCARPVGDLAVLKSKRCDNCQTSNSPTWRRGPDHMQLCNACAWHQRHHMRSTGQSVLSPESLPETETAVNSPSQTSTQSLEHDPSSLTETTIPWKPLDL